MQYDLEKKKQVVTLAFTEAIRLAVPPILEDYWNLDRVPLSLGSGLKNKKNLRLLSRSWILPLRLSGAKRQHPIILVSSTCRLFLGLSLFRINALRAELERHTYVY